MVIREAIPADISQIQFVRNAVKENTLSNPALVTDVLCEQFITERGKGWVCEINGQIVGFSIVDLVENNVWALFLLPDFEKKGIGKKLHDIMINWYFQKTTTTIWLGTSPNTRAEKFYRNAGWKEVGIHGSEEIKFEMNYMAWLNRSL